MKPFGVILQAIPKKIDRRETENVCDTHAEIGSPRRHTPTGHHDRCADNSRTSRTSGVMKADAMAQMPNELVVQGLARSDLASRRALDCPF
jgi:hypothetical protein